TLAREAGMSRARFAARFQERVGQAPLGYLTHWRMARACQQLLVGEPMVLVMICGRLGPLTLAFMLARPVETRIRYPEENVYTG
ncbi:MAG: helix-turn-helix domain-containing protein, partial [Aeromonas veronii]